MIISNQEIAIHLHKIRNLTSMNSGRYILRISLEETLTHSAHHATPVALIEKEHAKPDNKSEIDEQHIITRTFPLKSSANVELNEVYIFKLDSAVLSSKEEESTLTLTVQLIQIDNNRHKIVGCYSGIINGHAAHQYIQMDFYELAPCQILGSFHRMPYKFQFKSDNLHIDLRTFCQKYYKTKIDEILQYLQNQCYKNYQDLAQYSSTILQEEIDNDYIQLERTIIFKVMESQIDFCERQTDIGNFQEYASVEFKQATKKRKRIFSTTKDHRIEKYEAVQKNLHQNAQKTYILWRDVLQRLVTADNNFLTLKSEQYRKKLHQKTNESITSCKGSRDSDIYGGDTNLRDKLAAQLRNQSHQFSREEQSWISAEFPIINKSFFSDKRPIFFEQKSLKESPHSDQLLSDILVILVHGLGACRLDMEKLKIQLKRYYDNKVRVIASSTNQGRTEGDIQSMGMRLASQIDYQFSKYSILPKVCLVGHSMGGLIIRSALPRLQKYKKYFHSFISLSSPHLGYSYSNSKLVDAGLWFMNTVKKCTSLMQLTMNDNDKLQQTFLYKLSEKPGLQWFKKIVLLGSHQDLYVPYYSARIQKHKQSIEDSADNVRKGEIYCNMVNNILKNVNGNIIRLDVNFCIPEQNIDNLIGRAAHISFINNIQMLRTFALAGRPYFF